MTVRDHPSIAAHASQVRSPAHGFCDDEPTRRLIRSRPPQAVLQWASEQMGAPVVSARAMRGGMSSAVHLLTTRRPDGLRSEAVLRRYVRPELNEEEPDIAAREARALRFIERIDLPTPRVLALDATGSEVGVPTILMSRLRGRVDWWPSDLERWLRRLAEILPLIHISPPGCSEALRLFSPYAQSSYEPPPWSEYPQVWVRAVEIAHEPAPTGPSVVIHRDFHPGNVLWWRRTVSGVVDWQAISVGPAVMDVGHCRLNLLSLGSDVAERFTRMWEGETGNAYHPWADVVSIIGCLDDLREGWGSDRLVVEATLAKAVSSLSSSGQRPKLRTT